MFVVSLHSQIMCSICLYTLYPYIDWLKFESGGVFHPTVCGFRYLGLWIVPFNGPPIDSALLTFMAYLLPFGVIIELASKSFSPPPHKSPPYPDTIVRITITITARQAIVSWSGKTCFTFDFISTTYARI